MVSAHLDNYVTLLSCIECMRGRLLGFMIPGVMRLHCANMNEWIELVFGVETLGNPRNRMGIAMDSTQPLPNCFGGLLVLLLMNATW